MRVKELASVEAKNFELTLDRLGDRTIDIGDDLEAAYIALPTIVILPETETGALAVYAVLHHLALAARQLSLGVLTLMRAHRGDALLHLRRAIEATAFAARIIANPDLVRAWMNASEGEAGYTAYRRAFKTADLFVEPGRPNHEPRLWALKVTYDWCSRVAHGSVFGLGGHIDYPEGGAIGITLNFFDLPSDHSIISTLFLVFDSHRKMLDLFGSLLEPYTAGRITEWRERFNAVDARIELERSRWMQFVPDPRAGE